MYLGQGLSLVAWIEVVLVRYMGGAWCEQIEGAAAAIWP